MPAKVIFPTLPTDRCLSVILDRPILVKKKKKKKRTAEEDLVR